LLQLGGQRQSAFESAIALARWKGTVVVAVRKIGATIVKIRRQPASTVAEACSNLVKVSGGGHSGATGQLPAGEGLQLLLD
jgi:hypothetical protein